MTRVAAVLPLRQLSATGHSTTRNVSSLVVVKGDVPGQDAGEFSASLARYKRFSLLLRGLSAKTMEDRCNAVIRLDRWLRRERQTGALQANEEDLAEWAMSLPWKASSRATEIGRIKAFYCWRFEKDNAPDNPAATLPTPSFQPGEPRPIEDDVLTRAFQLARDLADWRIGLALILAAFGGLRIGEVARLRRDDFQRLRDGQVMVSVVGKGRGGGKHREVKISAAVFDLLVESGLPAHGPVMPRLDGRAGSLPAPAASHLLNNFLRHTVGTHHKFHSLRHWFGTETYDLTRDIRLVQELMGHRSPSTTAGYVRIVETRSSEAADALDTRLPDLGLAPVHDLTERRRRKAEGGPRGGGPGRRDPHRADGLRARVVTPIPGMNYEPATRSCRDTHPHRQGPGCP